MLDLIGSASGLMIVAAVIAAVIGTIAFRAHRAGVRAQEEKQRRADAAAVRKADSIDDAVAGRTADENRGRLGKWSRD